MDQPCGDHSAHKIGVIRVGHVHALLAVLTPPKRVKRNDDQHLVVPHRGAALHTILYNLSSADLQPPPTSREEKKVSSNFLSNLERGWLTAGLRRCARRQAHRGALALQAQR